MSLVLDALYASSDGQYATSLVHQERPSEEKIVLLAEDDDCLRTVMESVLAQMGYHVVSCANAQLASTAFRNEPVDLLLTDFQMPGRTGMELAHELTLLRSTLPVILITGSILSLEAMTAIQERDWLYLPKPCSMVALQAHLSRMLRTARADC